MIHCKTNRFVDKRPWPMCGQVTTVWREVAAPRCRTNGGVGVDVCNILPELDFESWVIRSHSAFPVADEIEGIAVAAQLVTSPI